MISKLILPGFFDAHCHFRLGAMMDLVVPFTASYSNYGLAMPNTKPRPILTARDVIWYRNQLSSALCGVRNFDHFQSVMTIGIRDDTTPAIAMAAIEAGAVAGKVYPLGVTTNSEDGLRNFFSKGIRKTFAAMEEMGMLLLLHGEIDKPRLDAVKREQAFFPILKRLVKLFPKLKIVLEHVTSVNAVRLIQNLDENVAATIAPHYLWITQNDLVGYGLQPHNVSMPTAKFFRDQDALIAAAVSGNPKFFLGSDSAPHKKSKKECAKGACGIFTAPVLPSIIVEIFEREGKLPYLENFTSGFGTSFYGLPRSEKKITLVRKDWTVPRQYGQVVPFKAGETLSWQQEL